MTYSMTVNQVLAEQHDATGHGVLVDSTPTNSMTPRKSLSQHAAYSSAALMVKLGSVSRMEHGQHSRHKGHRAPHSRGSSAPTGHYGATPRGYYIIIIFIKILLN